MGEPLVLDRDAIVALCRLHGVVRLAVFGSAITDHFDPDRSDVDMTVEFGANIPDLLGSYFGLKEDLERLLRLPVDLVVGAAIENPFFAAEVARTEELLYAA